MKSNRQIAREWLSAQDGPKWMSEILAALRAQGIIMRSSAIAEMVRAGHLIKTLDANGVACYAVGHVPGFYSPEQIQARKEKRREYERERSRRRVRERRAQRQAAGIPLNPRGGQRKPAKLILVTSHATSPGQSVEEFLAAGGRIERLPGLKTSNIYPPRRPGMAPGMRVAP